MQTKEGYKNFIEKFDYYQTKTIDSKYSFLKSITTLCLGFLALFVNFRPAVFINELDKLFFLITSALFGLCILFSLISQKGEVSLNHQASLARMKILLKYMDSENANFYQAEPAEINKIYRISEQTTYACLISAILSLIVYVYFSLYC
jgi:hypothetical protein